MQVRYVKLKNPPDGLPRRMEDPALGGHPAYLMPGSEVVLPAVAYARLRRTIALWPGVIVEFEPSLPPPPEPAMPVEGETTTPVEVVEIVEEVVVEPPPVEVVRFDDVSTLQTEGPPEGTSVTVEPVEPPVKRGPGRPLKRPKGE